MLIILLPNMDTPGEYTLLDLVSVSVIVLPACKLSAHKEQLACVDRITHIRVRMFPDGGISRVGILGRYHKED